MPGIGIGISPCFTGGVKLWTPRDLSPLLWLRADRGITLNGSDVAAWADQSGNGYDFAQTAAGKQPAFTASGGPGGQPALDFVLANRETLVGPTIPMPAVQFHFAVISQDLETQDQQLWSNAGSKNITEPVRSSMLSYYHAGTGAVTSAQATQSGAQVLAWHARVMTVSFYRDWVLLEDVVKLSNVTDASSLDSWIGSNQDGGGWFDGRLAEYCILSAAPSAADLAKLAAYTLARYGI